MRCLTFGPAALRPPRIRWAAVAATRGELEVERGVAGGDPGHVVEDIRGMEGIVPGAQEECGDADVPEVPDRRGAIVVIGGVAKAVDDRGEGIVERPERAGGEDACRVGDAGVLANLLDGLAPERLEEVPGVDAREAAVAAAAAAIVAERAPPRPPGGVPQIRRTPNEDRGRFR